MSNLTASQLTFSATVVDEWCRAGIGHAVVSPGSRSTPLALSLAAESRMQVTVQLDERSAGFFALGIALASGEPVIVVTTSGTAAAELHPAVLEAHHARVPLIVCTADRPPELHDVGAPQTVRQRGLFAGALRYELDLPVPDAATRSCWRSFASRLACEATASPRGPGPVHLNVSFREPLGGEAGELPPGRSEGRPWHEVATARRLPDARSLRHLVGKARRPLVVVGAGAGDAAVLQEAAARLGWPLLADPRSGCRSLGGEAETVVASADALLRAGQFRAAHRPDLVVRLGESWASKVLGSCLDEWADDGIPQVLSDPYGEWRDSSRRVGVVVPAGGEETMSALAELAPGAAGGWAAAWGEAEGKAQRAIEAFLAERGRAGELTEPAIARSLCASGDVGTVVASSSMPVRDVEWFAAGREGFPRVLSNRGANGIDGVLSTTAGVATATAGVVVGLVGDLAFLHDLSGLVEAREGPRRAGFGLVVVDNAGGGIFSFLPQAAELPRERFELLFGTPQLPDIAEIATACGLRTSEARSAADLLPGLAELATAVSKGERSALVCRTDRRRNVAVHEELNAAVAAALV